MGQVISTRRAPTVERHLPGAAQPAVACGLVVVRYRAPIQPVDSGGDDAVGGVKRQRKRRRGGAVGERDVYREGATQRRAAFHRPRRCGAACSGAREPSSHHGQHVTLAEAGRVLKPHLPPRAPALAVRPLRNVELVAVALGHRSERSERVDWVFVEGNVARRAVC